MQFSDPNPGQSITVTSNAAAVLPGATFTTTGTNPVTATVCWTATAGAFPIGIAFKPPTTHVRGQHILIRYYRT